MIKDVNHLKKEKQIKTEEQKREIKNTVLTVLLALIAVAAVVSLLVYYVGRNRPDTPAEPIRPDVTDLGSITLSNKAINVPYVTTDIPSVVYTADTARQIKFYEFNGSEYLPVEQTGQLELHLLLSNQQIPVTIHYIERDGQLTGYGVYTASENDDIYIYDFLLCKITNLPKGFEQDGKCLLLVNTDKKNVYSLSPVWEESFILNRETKEMTRFLSDGNRMLDVNGAMRKDFFMLTDSSLENDFAAVPFFSSRMYEMSGEDTPVDMFIKTTASEELAVSNVLDTYARPLADGSFAYLEAMSGGFSLKRYSKGETVTLKDFYSEYSVEYVRSGDWLLCKEDGRLYSLADGTVIELPEFKMNPNCFAVSSDGKFVVIAGSSTNVLDYRIYIYNTQSEKLSTFADSDYSTHYNLFFSGETSVCFYTESSEGYVEKVIDLSKLG